MKKNKSLLFILLVAGLSIFTWVFIWPKASQVLMARKNLDQETVRLERLRVKVSDLKSLNEFELSQRAELVLKAVPAGKKFLEVLVNFNKLANNQGVVVESFRVLPGELAATQSGKLTFTVSLLGSQEGVKNFLAEAEKSLPLVDIKKVKITTEKDVFQAELNFENYFFSLPATLGKLDSTLPKLTADEEKVLGKLSGFTSFPAEVLPPPMGKPNPFTF